MSYRISTSCTPNSSNRRFSPGWRRLIQDPLIYRGWSPIWTRTGTDFPQGFHDPWENNWQSPHGTCSSCAGLMTYLIWLRWRFRSYLVWIRIWARQRYRLGIPDTCQYSTIVRCECRHLFPFSWRFSATELLTVSHQGRICTTPNFAWK